MSEAYRWDYTALFPDPQAYQEALNELRTRAEVIAAWRKTLDTIDEKAFLKLVQEIEAFTELGHRARAYALLHFYEDSGSETAQAEAARINNLLGELATQTLFFELWWQGLEDDRASALLAAAGDRYRYWLLELRSWRPYTLSEEAERAIQLKNVAARAHARTYSVLNDRYRIAFEVEGKRVTIQKSELGKYTHHKNPAVRRAAYDAALTLFERESLVLGELYRLVVQDWQNEYVKLRGFASPIAARNKMNDLPDGVVEALLEAVRAEAPVFHEYFHLKAGALGQKKLSRYDLYAPVAESERRYSFEEARELVAEAFQNFDPTFAQLADRVVSERHVDVFPRPGKRGGAFSYGPVPGVTPYLLLNFQGEARDVATLAHELGHAVHALLAEEHPVFTFHAPLPLAEMASTFGEILLSDKLLAEEKDPTLKAQILFDQLDDAYATVVRQAYFAFFEIEAHRLLAEGAPLSEAHGTYLNTLREQFGDAVEVPEGFRYEWLMVPHFYHTPFYVYAYAFGQLLVYALYRRYQEEGRAFAPRLKRLLSAGGSQPPVELLAREGFDVADPGFWREGFAFLAERIGVLKELLQRSRA